MEQSERDLLEEANNVATLCEYFAWVQRCDEYIEQSEGQSRAKRPRLCIGNRQSLVARIARLEELKKHLERRFIHFGGDYTDQPPSAKLSWRENETAFENRILTGAVVNANYIDPQRFLEDASSIVLDHVRNAIEQHNSVKVNTVFNGEFVAGEKTANKRINTKNRGLFPTFDLQEWFTQYVIEPTLASLEEFQERDSGWALSRILNLTIIINKYNPLHAGCYITLPEEIKTKKAVVNVRSMDNASFAWAVVAVLYPAERHTERESSYPHYTTVLNLQGIEFPISINVYGTKEQNKKINVLPLRLADEMDKHANLLYVQDPRDNSLGHFACIKNLSRLVSSQINKQNGQKYICDRCLHYFYTKEKLEAHTMDCNKMNDCTIILPNEEDKWLTFNNHSRKEQMPYRSRRDIDCISWFVEQLKELAHRVKAILSRNVPGRFNARRARKV
ncbi:hypothetical protein X777_12309 [Ooceraea biroi]|uniref:C2H2-type domain-containing protein n=1 Tax=Ooceraea biroi TaxID=2015173 RepID=A0A026W0D2_OOCBI|nr:hypothetical protein X777_12309 [Ooceraea biroi]